MRFSLLLLLVISSLISCSKNSPEVQEENIFTIQSDFIDEAYEIKVLLPEGYSSERQYKVVYMLDGYYHFDYMKSEFREQGYLDDVIFVGIFYKDYPLNITVGSGEASVGTLLDHSSEIGRLRTLDLTYPENIGGAGGRGDLFYEFIKSELIPEIDSRYATLTSDRTIMGHSLGGYFVMYLMFDHTNDGVFDNVICLDTQIWWADLYLLEREEAIATEGSDLPFKFYMGVAKHANFDTNVLVDEFHEQFSQHSYRSLEYKFERYKDGHTYSAKAGFSRGLNYIFNE